MTWGTRIWLVLWIALAAESAIALAEPMAQSATQSPAPAEKLLIDFNSPDAAKQVTPTKGVPASIIKVDTAGISMGFPIQPAPHSGVHVAPATGKVWDLSAYGHISAKVTNLDKTTLPMVMHVVNGSEGWWQELNTEAVDIPPGETRVLTVYFGYQYGFEPSPAFEASSINDIYLFLYDTNQPHAFRIEELKAGGAAGEKPYTDPATASHKPANGVILGPGVAIDQDRQIHASGAHAQANPDGGVAVEFSGGAEESVDIKPPIGLWNLSDANELRVKIKNVGQTAATPAVALGPIRQAVKDALAPGAETEIVLPFSTDALSGAKTVPPGTQTTLESDKVGNITIFSDTTSGPKKLLITSIVADVATDDMPDWLGKKPPVDGDWTQTLDQEFNDAALDLKLWNIERNNHIDGNRSWNHDHNPKLETHFSKDDVILKDGLAILRLDKKNGKNNGAPGGKESDYASGAISTLGKWTQRYGYFESRMKLPKTPGLWAAFALLPDRGKGVTPPLSRFSAAKLPMDHGSGGLEFDPMNQFSQWGAYRFSVGVRTTIHSQKAFAFRNTYVKSDKNGYVTTGLLWTPGEAVFYNNGKELFRWKNARVGDVEAYLCFDLITGSFNNTKVNDAELPADFSLDYVRVWQRKDLASPEDGPKSNDGDPNEARN